MAETSGGDSLSEELRLRALLFISLLILTFSAYAGEDKLYGHIYNYGNEPYNAVVVEKDTQTLYIVKVFGDRLEVLKTFSVLTGKNGGDKVQQGDHKTPEGVYTISSYISPEKLLNMYGDYASTYGAGAFPLNYPNPADRSEKKSGGGIWLHGVDDNRIETTTKGCVALQNADFKTLSEYVGLHTPVVITEKLELNHSDGYAIDKIMYKTILSDFINSWQTNDFDTFSSFYHINFKGGGQNFASFLTNKKRLMKIFPRRTIKTDGLNVFVEKNGRFAMSFNQFYCAPNLSAYGKKTLYFRQELGDEYRIIAEHYNSLNQIEYIKTYVAEFVLNWKAAWESMDIDQYIDHYSEDITFPGGLKGFASDKLKKFEKFQKISVKISDLKFRPLAPDKFSVTFVQDFDGQTYKDRGLKTLILSGCPGEFKITSEDWRALK